MPIIKTIKFRLKAFFDAPEIILSLSIYAFHIQLKENNNKKNSLVVKKLIISQLMYNHNSTMLSVLQLLLVHLDTILTLCVNLSTLELSFVQKVNRSLPHEQQRTSYKLLFFMMIAFLFIRYLPP